MLFPNIYVSKAILNGPNDQVRNILILEYICLDSFRNVGSSLTPPDLRPSLCLLDIFFYDCLLFYRIISPDS